VLTLQVTVFVVFFNNFLKYFLYEVIKRQNQGVFTGFLVGAAVELLA
jgi:hypothetical protein